MPGSVQESIPPVWSKTQVSALADCRRKFFFNLKSSDKTEPDSPLLSQLARLKKLKNRHLWSGSVLHEEIGALLKRVRQSENGFDAPSVVEAARMKMRQQYKASVEGHPESGRLFEHEYNIAVGSEAWQDQWKRVEQGLRWFLDSKWMKRLCAIGPECWKAVDEILSFEVNGVRAFSKMDCAVESGGRFVLMDWKTSAPNESAEPGLLVSALYAHEVWGAEVDQMEAVAVSVLDGKTFHAHITEEALMETHLKIEEESARLEEAKLALGEDVFAIEPAGPEVCRRCSYQRICHP